jgi:cobalt/nickel transport system permease protein
MTGHYHGERGGFIEHSIAGLHAAIDRALNAERNALRASVLQQLDPRVKVGALSGFLLLTAASGKLWVVSTVLCAATTLALVSGISLGVLITRLWLMTLPFSGALALPTVFLTPGTTIYRLPVTDWAVSAQGVGTAEMLVLRAGTAATLALVLVFTTPWAHILKALRMFRVPVVFVVILGMTCRYILLLLEAAQEMFESRKSRTVGALSRDEQRRIAVLSTGALLSRTLHLSNEVHLAMQARGFRGEVFILDDFRMKKPDWVAAATCGSLGAALLWAGL